MRRLGWMLFLLVSCAHTPDQETGLASYYGRTGRRTASGEPVDPQALAAAHRTLPFGTLVRVTEMRTGRSVDVRINDRGPFVRGRILDLSPAAFSRLAPLSRGVVRVRMEVLQMGKSRKSAPRGRRRRP